MTKIAALVSAILFVPGLVVADSKWSGRVIRIHDGDTLTIQSYGQKTLRPTKVRLHGVDCPELKQPFGRKAKKFVAKLVGGQEVEVEALKTDKYGRTVGRVFFTREVTIEVLRGKRIVQRKTKMTVSVAEELLRAGLAWHYKKYDHSSRLAQLEQEAKDAGKGLWADKQAIAPWEWRHPGKTSGFRGNLRSKVFHAPGCRHFRCKNCKARFDSKAAAIKAGYRAHKRCVSPK